MGRGKEKLIFGEEEEVTEKPATLFSPAGELSTGALENVGGATLTERTDAGVSAKAGGGRFSGVLIKTGLPAGARKGRGSIIREGEYGGLWGVARREKFEQ